MKFLLGMLLVSNVLAWEVVQKNNKFYLHEGKLKVDEVITIDPASKDLETKKLDADLTMIYYLESNTAGTKDTSKVWNCALYSQSQKKLIFKDLLCRTMTTKDGKTEVEHAKFSRKGKKIIYQYEELEQTF